MIPSHAHPVRRHRPPWSWWPHTLVAQTWYGVLAAAVALLATLLGSGWLWLGPASLLVAAVALLAIGYPWRSREAPLLVALAVELARVGLLLAALTWVVRLALGHPL